MRYVDDPQRILLENRTRTPTLQELTEQVKALARLAINAVEDSKRIEVLETTINSFNLKRNITNPIRTLDTDFIVHNNFDADVVYAFDLSVVASIIGIAINEARISLLVNGIEMDSAKHTLQSTIVLGLSLQPSHRYTLSAFVLAGSTVSLNSTIIGTGTAAIVTAVETTYGI